MEIIKTYIVYLSYNHPHYDDEYVKLYELKNGLFFTEDKTNFINKVTKEKALELINKNYE